MLSEEKRKCLVDEWIEIGVNTTKKYYESLGYKKYRNTDGKLIFKIRPWDLTKGSSFKVKVKCSKCNQVRLVRFVDFYKVKSTICLYCNGKTTKKDLTGQRFGRLIALKDTGKRYRGKLVIWKCLCDCGNYTEAISSTLLNETKKSCGCLQKEAAKKCISAYNKNRGCFVKEYHSEDEIEEYLKNIKDQRQIDFKWINLSKKLRKTGQCKICKSKENLVVHHLNDYWKFPEQRYDEDNLVVLCRSCHCKFHGLIKEITKETFINYLEAI